MTTAIPDESVTLKDKYVKRSGRVYLSGVQALVRLPLIQRARDVARGLNTAGFISGYRGSPLATYDTALWGAKSELEQSSIHFQPGLNEDLAATAVWGTQQLAFQPDATVDGVFAIWYAKGPGVDRSMDAVKHANAAGTAPLGGVLAIFGDDHGAQSSTLLHQSEQMFEAACIPVLNPSDVHEHIVYGLYGFEMSRFSGSWVALKATTEVVESSASIDAIDPPVPVIPGDFKAPVGGLGIRWPDNAIDQERRMFGPRMQAIAAFARANPIDRLELATGPARLGIATTGKAYSDVIQALAELGIGQVEAEALGLRLYKFGLTWPIETTGALGFAEGLGEILVVEEKRAFIEPQLLTAVQQLPARPRVVGKSDEQGGALLPSEGELSPPIVAAAIVARLQHLGVDVMPYQAKIAALEALSSVRPLKPALERRPFFCSGCPHSSSTKLPEGSRAMAGTGCHSMAMYIPSRNASTLTQMGGEGVNWIGQAPFTTGKHVFVNLGDGTFSHSGLLAIRAAAAAGVNVTYKILFNDAVAMTGGQENDAHLKVDQIAHQVLAEGAKQVVVLAENVGRHDPRTFPPGTRLLDRGELEAVQRELRDVPGLTVIIFDQVCAAEKRRRRKRKLYPEGPKRVFINEEVCESCGDCSVQSNCISVVPVATPLGRKRMIDQSSCNSDYSCLKGFCPSFVTLAGARPRKHVEEAGNLEAAFAALPSPTLASLDDPYNILVTGIGGTGVITVGALMGMAAHLEGKAVTVLDFTGLAQKNGAVTSHIRLANTAAQLGPTRIVAGSTDLVLACDSAVATSPTALSRMGRGRTRAIVNTHVQPPAAFVLDPDLVMENAAIVAPIMDLLGVEKVETINATEIATRLTGDSIFANLFMLGYAWQRGTVPLGMPALMRAIELNGAAVAANKNAFMLGRLASVDPEKLQKPSVPALSSSPQAMSVEEIIADRRGRLVQYQNDAYARRYDMLVQAAATAAQGAGIESGALTEAIAKNFYKLMAYKDEYEVARLYTNGDFKRKLNDQFENGGRLEIHLSPPLLARRDPVTGLPGKMTFGPWMFKAFGLMARLKGLRGTVFDIFGYTAERRMERRLIDEYETMMLDALRVLTPANLATVTELAALPQSIRGYGYIKDRNVALVEPRRVALLAQLAAPPVLQQSSVRNGLEHIA